MFYTEYNFFKLNFIEPASPLMYGIIELHDHIFFFLNMILFLVLFLFLTTLNFFTYVNNSKKNRFLLVESVNFFNFSWLRTIHGTTVEIIWTIIPSIILVLIAIPSFALLYATDELVDPSVTIQVIGHQWYWSYEYNIGGIETFQLHLPVFKKVDRYFTGPTLHEIMCLKYQKAVIPSWVRATLLSPRFDYYEFMQLVHRFLGYENMALNFKILNYLLTDWLWDLINSRSVLWGKVTQINIPRFSYLTPLPRNYAAFTMEWELTTVKRPYTKVFQFDSYMRQESDLTIGEHRLYETDFPLVLPKSTHIRFLITADDVIHSRSVPSLGIKVDAVPGRINQAHTFIKRSGIFYGQCSELCGVNHAFTPIQIIAFEPSLYYEYLDFLFFNK